MSGDTPPGRDPSKMKVNETSAYMSFQAFKLNRGHPEHEATTHRASSRADMYRSTFESVLQHGLLWEAHPIEVSRTLGCCS